MQKNKYAYSYRYEYFYNCTYRKIKSKLTEWLSEKRFTVLFSEEAFTELIEVIHRPKFKKIFTTDRIIELLELLERLRFDVIVKSRTDICRDAKDNFLLNLCKDGLADYLITEDADLLVLQQQETTQIVSYREFANIISD